MIPPNISGNLYCFLPIVSFDDRAMERFRLLREPKIRRVAQLCHLLTGRIVLKTSDTAEGSQGVKERHHSFKLCPLYKSKPCKFAKCYCPKCSNGIKRKYLRNIRRDERADTCFTIWHSD
ncbi:hypothetical protein PHMEG_00039066 [Phytophthora megakarya]|uniref:PiggyBac transposable element-derived protein domain-containing protein n=1 Tax=Phytophthora megakarya TaxID=4795 RepID=A0A225UIX8_9STRA|nr:hypothetical protein PHMEG_00039066 [Phytophthora megakarya]